MPLPVPALRVASPDPYELNVIGADAVPLPLVRLRLPENVWPPWNRTLSPALSEAALTLAIDFQGDEVLVPLLASLPLGLT